MKKLISIILVTMVLLSCAVPAFAFSHNPEPTAISSEIKFNPFASIAEFFNNFFEGINNRIRESVREKEGETVLEYKHVSVSFANKTFNVNPDTLNLYCAGINPTGAGIAPEGYCDYVITPKNSNATPMAYRIAILDGSGNIYRTTKNKYHNIEVSFEVPVNWNDCDTATVTKYEWSEKENKHIVKTTTVSFDDTVTVSETIL